MPGTSTAVVDPLAEDRALAARVLGENTSELWREWFARVMPVLRSHIRGVTTRVLYRHLAADVWDAELYNFLARLHKANVISWHRKDSTSYLVRLSLDYWLKEAEQCQTQAP